MTENTTNNITSETRSRSFPWVKILLTLLGGILLIGCCITSILFASGTTFLLTPQRVVEVEVPVLIEVPVVEEIVIEVPVEKPETVQPPTQVTNCKAVQVGGPVKVDGECSWCTVNYSYPGDVFIAYGEPITYTANAWVWQYEQPNNLEEFKACMNAQPFMADPDYTAIWPD